MHSSVFRQSASPEKDKSDGSDRDWCGQGRFGWMNVGTLMWDQSLSSASTIFLLLCAGMQSIYWKTQPSCKLIEGGDFLTVTLIKNKLLFEKTVHHPGTVLFPNYGTHAYSLTYFWKFSDGCQNRVLMKYRLLNFTPNCLYYSLGTFKKHQEWSLVLLNVTQIISVISLNIIAWTWQMNKAIEVGTPL